MNFKLKTANNTRAAGVHYLLIEMICALIITCLPMCPAIAGVSSDPFVLWQKVPDRELAKMRGGFITSDGLNINVGLERLVMIDGTVKTRFNLDLSGLGRPQDTPNPLPGDQNKMIQLVQNGEHNVVTADVPASFARGALTIIQNSLDGKLIQNLTTLQIDVSGMSQYRTTTLGRSINMEQIRALH